ncbi:hypothetical protein BCR35DRAFT_334631 [Leucosporidium creatinivorum]|uniref:Uncharacterized protein n=1 Tax=Leucosporidium creatinivorum TaxID=106004 RepID=A0A1Y2E2I0_9BASI|nr:hypothetical protein BCR35DRAFT_334631 [Leucosporidium creatinivorum]
MTSLVDDESTLISYSEGWVAFSNTTGTESATQWHNGTFHQCTSSTIASGPTCLATLAFTGTGAAVYADSSPAHGRYFCGLVGANGSVERRWWDGGSIAQWAVGRKLCSVSGLDSGSHSLVFGQAADDCGNSGISLDYITFSADTTTTTAETWSSDFNTTTANPAFTASSTSSTASAVETASIDSTSASSTAAAASSSNSINSTAIGAGVGVGGAALLGLVVAWILWSRRRKQQSTGGTFALRSLYPGGERDMTTIGSPSEYAAPSLATSKSHLPIDRHSAVTPYSTYSVPEVQLEMGHQASHSAAGPLADPRDFAPR